MGRGVESDLVESSYQGSSVESEWKTGSANNGTA